VTYHLCTRPIAGLFACFPHASLSVLRISAILLLAAPVAVAAHKAPPANPCNLSREDRASLNVDTTTDIHALSEYEAAVRRLFQAEKFEQLDCLTDDLRANKARFPGGMWKIHLFYTGLYTPAVNPTTQDWEQLLARFQKWMAARPMSITARVALATSFIGYAWEARGNGYADTVTKSGWNLFEQRIADARAALEEASSLPAKCPEWYVAMLEVAEAQSWDVAEARALFEKAFKFEPGYYYYERVMGNYLLPKWGGELGDTERFASEIADRLGGDDGDILYFQVANFLMCGCKGDPHLSWPRISKGFNASERLYGVSMLNLNLIALIASHRNDPIVADSAFRRIGDQWDEETWHKRDRFDDARKWAAAAAPYIRGAKEAEANGQTPGGARYEASFAKSYKKLIGPCIKTGSDYAANFKTLTRVGAKGTIEDVRIEANSDAAVCIYQRLTELKSNKARPFPPPPSAPFWVKLEIKGSELTPVLYQPPSPAVRPESK
jgi:Domain of unknown function (DUF4034)